MDCESIESFVIPQNVISIGRGIFSGCAKLSTITVSENNAIFRSPDNCNAIISGQTLIAGCKNTTIPTTITTIGEMAMKNLVNATIVIPDNITDIRYLAFMDLRNSNITLPSTAVSIGDHAFSFASNTTFLSPCQNPSSIHKDAFTTIDSYKPTLVLKVPKGTKEAYASATGWKEISVIEELPGEGDTFTAKTIEGIKMTFKVLDASQKTVQVGDGTGAAIAETTAVHVTIPAVVNDYNVVSIGDKAFSVCCKMSGISIPASVTQIGESAFSECLSLSLISIAATSPFDINPSTFCNYTRPQVIVPAGTVNDYQTKKGWSKFSHLSDKRNIQFANAAMKNICVAKWDTDNDGELSYLEAAAVKEVSGIFRNNYEAEIASFEEFKNFISVQEFGSFSQKHLEKICIPVSVAEIDPYVFEGCPKLWDVTIDEMNDYYAVVDTVLYKKDMKTLVACLANKKGEFEIPSDVVEIGVRAFAYCPEITTVVIPISVTTIGPECFGANTPSIRVGWTEPIQISGGAIPGSAYMTLIVPFGTKSAYQAADKWKNFGTITEYAADHAIITAKSYSRAYGEPNPSFGFNVVGQEITGTPAIACNATPTSTVGTYDILISKGTVSADNAEYVNGTLTITKAPLKITVKSYTRKEGEANPEFGVTYEGFVNDETTTVLLTQPTVSCSATESSPAGTYEITVSGASATNYEISYVAGTLTVEAVKPADDTPAEPEPKEENEFTGQDVSFEIIESSDGSNTVAIKDDNNVTGSYTIPETVTHDGVEYKVTEIAANAFQNNTALTEVTIPASIISIGAGAFAGCTNLKSITINIFAPLNLASAAARAFVRGMTRASGDDVFEGVDKNTCILYVPEESVDAYKAAPVWKEFKNILPIKTSTGIHGIEISDGEVFDVYNLSGQKVKARTTSLDGLPRGIYIINSKKVMK